MVVYVHVLSTDSIELSPSVFVSTEKERFLFNIGDGIQRLCMEHRIRLGKLSHIFLTQLNPNTLGGLPGMIMTVADTCNQTALNIFGPPKTKSYLHATRHFLQRPNMILQATDVELMEQDSCSSAKQTLYVGEEIMIHAYPMRARRNIAPCKRKLVELDGSAKADIDVMNGISNNNDIAVSYAIETLPQRGKFLVDRAIALGVPKGKLFGQLHNGESVTLPNGNVIHPEDCVAPSIRGGICLIVSCPSTEFIGELRKMSEIRKCHEFDEKSAVDTEEELKAEILVVYHLTPNNVLQHPSYIEWIKCFGEQIHHVLLGHHTCPVKSVYRASAEIQASMHRMLPHLFPSNEYEKADSSFRNQLNWTEALRHSAECPKGSVIIGESMLRYGMSPPKNRGFDRQSCFQGFTSLGRRPTGVNDVQNSTHRPHIMFLGTGCAVPSKFRNVTGIYLSLNGRTVDPANDAERVLNGIMLDCGEGSLGQLYRAAAGDRKHFVKLLGMLQCIWISHNHADHHLGLLRVLHFRAHFGLRDRVLIIGPTQIQFWLEEYASIDPTIISMYKFVDNKCFSSKDVEYDSCISVRENTIHFLRETLNITHLETVPVKHAQYSYGVVFVYNGGTGDGAQGPLKIAFSGDCRPSEQFAKASEGAFLLIHEATFEDGMEKEAKEKCHCTISQALHIGEKAKAQHVILTHFSQRYPKTASLNGLTNIMTAFDLLSLPLGEMRQPEMMKACTKLLNEGTETE